MLFLQTDAKAWGFLWERYGLAAVILAIVILGIWRWLIPLINQLLADSRADREQERKDFLAALDNVTTKHNQAVAKLAESIDGIRDEVRRSRG